MEFEWNLFLITMGMLISFGCVGMGVTIGRVDRRDKEQCERSDTSGVLSDDRLRMGSGSDGCDIPLDREEITNVLWVLRLGASYREKRVIDYLLDKEGVND